MFNATDLFTKPIKIRHGRLGCRMICFSRISPEFLRLLSTSYQVLSYHYGNTEAMPGHLTSKGMHGSGRSLPQFPSRTSCFVLQGGFWNVNHQHIRTIPALPDIQSRSGATNYAPLRTMYRGVGDSGIPEPCRDSFWSHSGWFWSDLGIHVTQIDIARALRFKTVMISALAEQAFANSVKNAGRPRLQIPESPFSVHSASVCWGWSWPCSASTWADTRASWHPGGFPAAHEIQSMQLFLFPFWPRL